MYSRLRRKGRQVSELQTAPQEALQQIMYARYYGSGIGRFLSADPSMLIAPGSGIMSPSDLSWDRFTYVRNNPLKLTDPTGLEEEQPQEEESPVPSQSGNIFSTIWRAIRAIFRVKSAPGVEPALKAGVPAARGLPVAIAHRYEAALTQAYADGNEEASVYLVELRKLIQGATTDAGIAKLHKWLLENFKIIQAIMEKPKKPIDPTNPKEQPKDPVKDLPAITVGLF
ncbi:MAG: RHS repeat domain-containing protein [Thermoanaerobaculia bacterium]